MDSWTMVALQRGPIYAVETFFDLINLSLRRKHQRPTYPGRAVQHLTQHWSLIPSVLSPKWDFCLQTCPSLFLWEDPCCFSPVSTMSSHGLTSLTFLRIHQQKWKRNRWSRRTWTVTLGNQNEPLLSDSLGMSGGEDWHLHCQSCAGWGQPSVPSGPALRHPEVPGCSRRSTLGQGSIWHGSKQSREPPRLYQDRQRRDTFCQEPEKWAIPFNPSTKGSCGDSPQAVP